MARRPYNARAGTEGTVSQAVRGPGLRHSQLPGPPQGSSAKRPDRHGTSAWRIRRLRPAFLRFHRPTAAGGIDASCFPHLASARAYERRSIYRTTHVDGQPKEAPDRLAALPPCPQSPTPGGVPTIDQDEPQSRSVSRELSSRPQGGQDVAATNGSPAMSSACRPYRAASAAHKPVMCCTRPPAM
jgi:hypothetical protein